MSATAYATILQSAVLRTRMKHRPAPSLFYFPGLSTDPVFHPDRFACAKLLEDNYKVILDEYEHLRSLKLGSDYSTREEHKLHQGKWDWNSYIIKGKRQADFAVHCPKTVEIIESIDSPSRLMSDTPFSFAFFSTLYPDSSIAAHHGPCNLRIRCHLPLKVPSSSNMDNDNGSLGARNDDPTASGSTLPCGMRVGDVEVEWKVGKPVFFDDCYQHSVWNHTPEDRVLLLFDMWHPELHPDEIEAIKHMFRDAKEKGWLT